jgi:cyclopropane fatty-acyl-phospholipid synthase-like methyltransferase
MSNVIDRATFWFLYAGTAPWDIGRPQAPFIAVADLVVSPVLEAGCGSGENALFFAAQGHQVTGIDFLSKPIRQARVKADERGLSANFIVKDALSLRGWDQRFASVIDCGLFHVFSDDDRRRYVEGLSAVLAPGGRLFLMCFSDQEPPGKGPRRVSRQELLDAFAEGFEIEIIKPSRFEVNAESTDFAFSEKGPKAWFAIFHRRVA